MNQESIRDMLDDLLLVRISLLSVFI